MKKILFAALAATTLLAACSKDNTGNGAANGETKNVYLKVEQASSPVRSVADKVTIYTVEFSSGALFFVDSSTGMITKYFTITTSATSTANLNIGELTTTGISGIEVPETSKDVYVVANVPSGVTLPTAGMYSAVEDVIITAASQAGTITSGAIKGVMLYSGTPGTLTETSPGDGDWSTTVSPKQIANRLEITDIKAKAGSHVESFTIDGIYVNNFYSQKEIGTASAAGDLVDYASTAASYASGQGLYTTAGVFYDEPGADDVSLTVAAGTDKVWGYNLLAGAEVPHIVIKLSNIIAETGYTAPTGGTGFVTVKGFTNTDDSAISFATGGQVFTVAASGLEFGLEDITSVPEVQSINAKVTVSLTAWVPVPVKPEI